jgi:FixJ family two-component response regulator
MAPQTKQTVIVVDDDASTLRALERLLRSFDYEVVGFPSAEAFLAGELASEEVCLLLDVFLPGMSGIELVTRMTGSGRNIPTILMTAHDDGGTRGLLSTVGAKAVLYKPFDEDALLEAIARALGDSRAQLE